jgi:prevent-host-death family protein
MDISVSAFKQRCLEIVRRVERSGEVVTITRRGKAVARLAPPLSRRADRGLRPWEKLRALGGRLLASPEESVLSDRDFRALR